MEEHLGLVRGGGLSVTSLPTWPSSTFLVSIRKLRRPRRAPSGRSSMPIARRRMRNSPTSSTSLDVPDAVALDMLVKEADFDFYTWLRDRKNRRNIPHRLEQCGYIPVRNDAADDGLFKINNRRQAVYARTGLSFRGRLEAVRKLTNP